MTDTAAHNMGSIARSVFAGLVPQAGPETVDARRSAVRAKVQKGVFTTVPILLVGSMAAMTLNLTGPVEPVSAKPPLKPRGVTAELGKTIREAMAAATGAIKATTAAVMPASVAPAPTLYRVAAGDTVSDIAGRFGLSTASVLALNGLSWSSMIFPGQELKLTANGPIVAVAEEPAGPTAGRYTIIAGDTISAIADRFGISTLSVLTANGLGWSSIIYPGQTLAIPGLVGPDAVVEPGIEQSREADARPDASPVADAQPPVAEAPVEVPAPAVDAPAPAPVAGTHTVRSGDTLSGIAALYGIDTQRLLDANGLAWDSLIFPGDRLSIPGVSTPASVGGDVTLLNDEMRGNAAVIVQVGQELGVPDYGIVIALATAMQESTLRNLDWGDRDSVGLFQQRPSAGWGSAEQLTTPDYAARLFFGGHNNPNAGQTRGLLDISGWESMSLAQAAQAVQISAFPDAYATWEASAYAWLQELA